MIKLIDRYILRFHIAPFLFGFLTVVFLFLMQFLMRYLDQLVGKGLGAWVIFQLIAYNLSWMVVLAAPMGMLFSTLMAFGGLSANNEITIIKASGGSLISMMLPVVIVGALLTYGLFKFNDVVLPESNHRAKIMMNDIKRKKPTFALESGQFSSQLEGFTILARSVDSISGLLKGVTIYDQTRPMVKNIISADSGTVMPTRDFSKMILTLYNGEIHQVPFSSYRNYRVVDFVEYQIMLKAEGFTLENTANDMMPKGDREMTISEMRIITNDMQGNSEQARNRVQKVLTRHYDYLMGKLNDTLPLTSSIVSNHNNIDMGNRDTIRTTSRGTIMIGGVEKIGGSIRGNIKPTISAKSIATKSKVRGKAKIEKARRDSIDLARNNVIIKATVNSESETINNLDRRVSMLKSSMQSDIFQIAEFSQRADSYEVEIQKKYAIPFACFIFIFVGCPLGVMTRGGNFGVSAGISLGFYIFYWACLIGGEKLADRGMLTPIVSMWLGNFIIGMMGIFLTLRVNNESFSIPGMKWIGDMWVKIRSKK